MLVVALDRCGVLFVSSNSSRRRLRRARARRAQRRRASSRRRHRARCSTPCASGASSGAGPSTQVTRDRCRAHVEPDRAVVARHRRAHASARSTSSSTSNASDTEVPLPASLALPFEVTHRASSRVARLDWRVGTNRGTIRGLALRYAGGAPAAGCPTSRSSHRAWHDHRRRGHRRQRALPDRRASRAHRRCRAQGRQSDARASGSLAALDVDGNGEAGGARFTAHATLAPLAAVPLVDGRRRCLRRSISRRGTRRCRRRGSTSSARAQPASGGGIAGTSRRPTLLAGTLDAGRIPLRRLSARFSLARRRARARRSRGGVRGRRPCRRTRPAFRSTRRQRRARGRSTSRDVDLQGDLCAARRDAALRNARCRSRPQPTEDPRRRRAIARIAGGIALDFAAVVAGGTIDVERFRAHCGGRRARRTRSRRARRRARVRARRDRQPLRSRALRRVSGGRARRHDRGHRRARARVARRRGHRACARQPACGRRALRHGARHRHARRASRCRHRPRRRVRRRLDATRQRQLGAADDRRRGDARRAESRRARAAAAGRGAANADRRAARQGAMARTVPRRRGIELEANGTALQARAAARPAHRHRRARRRLRARRGRRAAGRRRPRDARDRGSTSRRPTSSGPQGTFTAAHARARRDARPARGHVALQQRRDGDVDAAAHGGLDRVARAGADMPRMAWKGTLDSLEERGPLAAAPRGAGRRRLRARRTSRIGATRLAVADGNVQLTEFTWDDGRITTPGSFTAVPLATAARIAGAPLPFTSTLTLGGEWSLAAAPRLNGTLDVRREGGDLQLPRESGGDPTTSRWASRRSSSRRASPTTRSTRRQRSRRRAATSAERQARHRHRRRRAARAHRRRRAADIRRERRLPTLRCCSRGSARAPSSTAARTSMSRRAAPWARLAARRNVARRRAAHRCAAVRRCTSRTAGSPRTRDGSVVRRRDHARRGHRQVPRVGRDHRGDDRGRANRRRALAWQAEQFPRVQPAGSAPRRRRRRNACRGQRQAHARRQARGRRRAHRLLADARCDARRRRRRQGLDAPESSRALRAPTCRSSSTCRSISATGSRSPARASTRGSPAPFG